MVLGIGTDKIPDSMPMLFVLIFLKLPLLLLMMMMIIDLLLMMMVLLLKMLVMVMHRNKYHCSVLRRVLSNLTLMYILCCCYFLRFDLRHIGCSESDC